VTLNVNDDGEEYTTTTTTVLMGPAQFPEAPSITVGVAGRGFVGVD